MKILVDMNLSPDWCPLLIASGWETKHWREVGDPRAPDRELLMWARSNGYVVLTHDLDFGNILAATGAQAPSVVQLRDHDVMPDRRGAFVVKVLSQQEKNLERGALLSIDSSSARVRLLPLP